MSASLTRKRQIVGVDFLKNGFWMLRTIFLSSLLFWSFGFGVSAYAADLKIAVAANFKPSLDILAKEFETKTGHRLLISSASTGTLYNQITNGAPFDLFLSADSLRVKMLEEKGLALVDSRHTYALGQLVLWSPGVQQNKVMTLKDLADYKGRLSIANPATAPYGLAAQQVLERIGLWASLRSRLVQGASIQQAWQFVASGNIPIGLVAKAQMVGQKNSYLKNNSGHVFIVPEDLYDPIQQDLVILQRTKQPEVAQAFVAFLLSQPVQSMLVEHGYCSVTTEIADLQNGLLLTPETIKE
ncbi:molybdate ABC transporter substrate-binding protein [Endozoicomonas sp.]|uniref:molybdate ABC transporter substrate-binding protein n=1 Tax=Endozoicomonas sp. TaxID=1892382 RepID=UPI002884A9F1|nr:molybdate ABC transporter substrate-binding protein [Endozoicomonas sp.]